MNSIFVKDDIQVCFSYNLYELGDMANTYYDCDGLQYDAGCVDSINVDILDEEINGADEVPEEFYEMLKQEIRTYRGCDDVKILQEVS